MSNELLVGSVRLRTTPVYDTYWEFAAERQRIYFRQQRGDLILTQDEILRNFRFTNAYRAIDRVTQFLISDVIAGSNRDPIDVFFRTLLFKIFNKLETWQLLERELGELHATNFDWEAADKALSDAMASGTTIYSAAYIMPSPQLGARYKHTNHLLLLRQLLDDDTATKWSLLKSLRALYDLLLSIPSFGRFLAFQYAIDLNYSDLTAYDEDSFVVAGPGALNGIAKCFANADAVTPEAVIAAVAASQDEEFERRGIEFPSLYGRRLKLIDCQNLFCEVDKYARVAHPEFRGESGRTRIKQTYKPRPSPLPQPAFPKSWHLTTGAQFGRVVPSAVAEYAH